MPPETFDFIIVNECHRSIYNVWRQVLEYFDAFLIGLTATPSKQTRREHIEEPDEDLEYESRQLDRSVTSVDQNRTVLRTFRDRVCTEIFPNRSQIPKTLIFAKDNNHAEEILHIVREEFGRGNEFAKKVRVAVMRKLRSFCSG